MLPFTQQRIVAVLIDVEGTLGANVHFIPQIGSTNDIAREMAADHAPEGTLVITDEQTQGRGRMGRTWEAPAASSLLMSLILRPDLPAPDAHRLVMMCGQAIAEGCEHTAAVNVTVKWPNDLQIAGKKLAGILPESAIVGDELVWVVVGMGINVNVAFAADNPLHETATSLRIATGQSVDRGVLLHAIMERMNEWYSRVSDPALDVAWAARCVTLGQQIQVQADDELITGFAQKIDRQGALWLSTANNESVRITASETTVVTQDKQTS